MKVDKRWVGGLAVAVVLGAVFASYLRPELVVDLAARIWLCF